MMPIIGARINDTVLNPISILIKSGKWDLSVQEQLLRYASEDYLQVLEGYILALLAKT